MQLDEECAVRHIQVILSFLTAHGFPLLSWELLNRAREGGVALLPFIIVGRQ